MSELGSQSADAPEGHMTASVAGSLCKREVCPDAVRVDLDSFRIHTFKLHHCFLCTGRPTSLGWFSIKNGTFMNGQHDDSNDSAAFSTSICCLANTSPLEGFRKVFSHRKDFLCVGVVRAWQLFAQGVNATRHVCFIRIKDEEFAAVV